MIKAGNYTFNNLIEMLWLGARDYGSKIAFIEIDREGNEREKITYSALHHCAKAIANELLQLKKSNGRCMLITDPGIPFAKALFGCLYAGMTAIPVHPPRVNKKNHRFWSILNDSDPEIIMLSKSIEEKFFSRKEHQTSSHSFTRVILDDISLKNGHNFEAPSVSPKDLAILQYTSGTTGQPLGTMLSHEGILHNLIAIYDSFKHDKNLIGVNWLPPYHDMGLIGTLLQPVFAGGSSVLINPVDFLSNPLLWLKMISKYKGTTVGCPNFALDLLSERIRPEEKKEINLSSVKVFFCGSEPIHKPSLDKFTSSFEECGFKEKTFLPCYGLAENTLFVAGKGADESPSYFSVNRNALEKFGLAMEQRNGPEAISLVSCGKPWRDDEIIIADPRIKRPLSEGKVGEIWVRSHSSCLGYWNKPVKSRELFQKITDKPEDRPFIRTGDMGFQINGELFIAGRIKDMIKIRGVNYYPHDIENIINTCHPALQANGCAVFGTTIEREEKLIIVQEIKRTSLRNLNGNEVSEAIQIAIANEFDLPVHEIILISQAGLPRTSSGKIMRFACKAIWQEEGFKRVFTWKPSGQFSGKGEIQNLIHKPDQRVLQNWLIHWLSKKTGVSIEQISVGDPIMSYGLDSMGAVELEREVKETFDIEIHLADFLENNTIAELSKIGMESIMKQTG